jgi:hypothetical protein
VKKIRTKKEKRVIPQAKKKRKKAFDHIVVGALCAQQKHKAALAQPVSR